MLSKEKAMYQAYLIIENLPENEKKLIPNEEIENLKINMEIDENIIINPEIKLNKQKIDDKTLDILESILKNSNINKIEKRKDNLDNIVKNKFDEPSFVYIKKLKELVIQNSILNQKLDNLKEENQDLEKYRNTLVNFKNSYEMLKEENEKLLKKQELLIKTYEEIPNIIKKIYLKNNKIKILSDGNK